MHDKWVKCVIWVKLIELNATKPTIYMSVNWSPFGEEMWLKIIHTVIFFFYTSVARNELIDVLSGTI